MKKILFSMLLATGSCVAFAQVDSVKTTMDNTTTMDNGTMTTTTDYNAYSTYTAIPPDYMGSYVVRDYPMATDVRWRQENDWWHGYYVTNGMPNHVYYNSSGQSFTVALPVRQSWVPETVVTKAVELFGPVIYDINSLKGTGEEEIYTVRLLENGQLSTIWIKEDGTRVLDVYRMETSSENAALNGNMNVQDNTNTNLNTDMNLDKDAKIKIKVKNSDGTETKTKIKDGKVKTKTDD